MRTFSFSDRERGLMRMEEEVFDLVVIGGGINGAGIARDACLRGMKVALVEASDFASGTSSRSSKLIHGGIRYLENLEFHLVFEALNERARLFKMAPHLVHPLRFMIPLYRGGRVGMFKMGLGMWLYDALALFEVPEIHERLSEKESVDRQPLLRDQDLLGSYVYSDAYMDDDRLVFETLRSAQQMNFAGANFVRAVGADLDDRGKVAAVRCRDLVGNRDFKLRGRHIVSTVGPWTDELGHSFFKNEWKDVLRPTKGVHLTFEKKRLPLSSAVVMGAEKRIVFGIPRHEMVIIGTTDTDFSGDPARVKTTREDVKYLLGVLDQYFPKAKITEKDIVASYEGVRPLVKDNAESEGKTSREHTIWTEDHGVTFVAGGKYTTYRLIAQQAVQHCLKAFPFEERVKFKVGDNQAPLNPLVTVESCEGNDARKKRILSFSSLSEESVDRLVDRHGAECEEFFLRYGPHLTEWQYEALHAIDHTMCLRLVDFFTRRVPLILAYRDHGKSVTDQVVPVFQAKFGWDKSEVDTQVQALEKYIASEFSWRIES